MWYGLIEDGVLISIHDFKNEVPTGPRDFPISGWNSRCSYEIIEVTPADIKKLGLTYHE